MDEIDAIAALLPGRTARRRATVLWRRLVDDPPVYVQTLAADLGVSKGTVAMDEMTGVLDLRRLRRKGVVLTEIPAGSRLHVAVFGPDQAYGPSRTSQ